MQSEAEKLIEEVAALINPGVFGPDANALLDAWSGRPHDRDAARRADVRYGLGLGVRRGTAREQARTVTALIVERCAKLADKRARMAPAVSHEAAVALLVVLPDAIRALQEAPQPEAKEAHHAD